MSRAKLPGTEDMGGAVAEGATELGSAWAEPIMRIDVSAIDDNDVLVQVFQRHKDGELHLDTDFNSLLDEKSEAVGNKIYNLRRALIRTITVWEWAGGRDICPQILTCRQASSPTVGEVLNTLRGVVPPGYEEE